MIDWCWDDSDYQHEWWGWHSSVSAPLPQHSSAWEIWMIPWCCCPVICTVETSVVADWEMLRRTRHQLCHPGHCHVTGGCCKMRPGNTLYIIIWRNVYILSFIMFLLLIASWEERWPELKGEIFEFLELLVLDDIEPTSSESALVSIILGLVVVTGKLGNESDL